MTDHDDINHAKRFLLMDSREWANAQAEIAKQTARRKAALAYGDSGSPVEPVTFVPRSCSACEDSIVTSNTSPNPDTCLWCYRSQAEKPKREPIAWRDIAWWLCLAVGVIALVAWVVVS